jgi:hypothetical protein
VSLAPNAQQATTYTLTAPKTIAALKKYITSVMVVALFLSTPYNGNALSGKV